MSSSPSRFERILAEFGARVHAVAPDGWSRPAPCEGWVAHDIVRHIVEWVPSVFAGAGLSFDDVPPADADPVAAWDAFAAVLLNAYTDPQIAAREFDVGPPGVMSVANALEMIVLGDVFVHTWDLARATGLDESLDPEMAAEMLAGMQPIDEMLRGSGHYGAKVVLGPDATVQDQLIAFTGRDPR